MISIFLAYVNDTHITVIEKKGQEHEKVKIGKTRLGGYGD